MERIEPIRRSVDAFDKPTYDFPHVWQNDVVHGGVKFISWVVVTNQTEKRAKIRVWVPQHPDYNPGAEVTIESWSTWGVAAKVYGSVSIVVDEVQAPDDLHMFWELTAVKA